MKDQAKSHVIFPFSPLVVVHGSAPRSIADQEADLRAFIDRVIVPILVERFLREYARRKADAGS